MPVSSPAPLHDDTPASSNDAGSISPPYLFLIFCFLLYVVRFGYGYGASDQDEFLPLLMHKGDPELFAADWFVQTQLEAFSVRTYFVVLLQILTVFMPVPAAVLLLYLISWMGIALAIFRMTGLIAGDGIAAAGAVPLAMVLTPFWTLGGNDLAHSMLVPSMSAWALGLMGLVSYLRRRYVPAGLWMGAATWMQALVGLQLAGLAGLLLLGGAVFRDGEPWPIRKIGVYTAAYILAALPALIPLIYQQLIASPGPDVDLFYVMAKFRNPHHYLFHSFPTRSLVRFGLISSLGVASLIALRARLDRASFRFLTRSLFASAAICLFAYAATELYPVLTVAKLQLFKLTVLAKLVSCITISTAGASLVPASLKTFARAFLRHRSLQAMLLTFAVLSLFGLQRWTRLDATKAIYPFSERASPEAGMERWIRSNTPRDAIFAVPPSLSSFRSGARRAIIVDHKAFPYRDADIEQWFARLTDMAPISLPSRTDSELPAMLDAAYESLHDDALRERLDRYRATYALRTTPLSDPPSFHLVYRRGEWRLYRLIAPRHP